MNMFGEGGSEDAVGNALVIADNSSSSFKLKFAMINHGYTFPIESMFMEGLQ